jgi:uncharacterized protein
LPGADLRCWNELDKGGHLAAWRAISARDDKSHKPWTDGYLAAFAQASDATLATLDTEFPSRYPSAPIESLLP